MNGSSFYLVNNDNVYLNDGFIKGRCLMELWLKLRSEYSG